MVTKDKGQNKETSGAELAKVSVSEDGVQAITSFTDAMVLLKTELGENAVGTALESLGDGFPILEDKRRLEGQPLLFIDWNFIPSEKTAPLKEGEEPWPGRGMFTSARVITSDNRKFRVNDSGQGMHRQLWEYSQKTGRQAGLVASGGLKVSDYTNKDGIEGTTVYIDTSA